MNKDELKKKYEGKTIAELESDIRSNMSLSREAQVEMIESLMYLKVTQRFKENPRYKNSSFKIYLEDNFGIREGTFMEQSRAIGLFRDEVLKHGIGLVAKTVSWCGKVKALEAFSEINKIPLVKQKGVPRAKIEQIIQSHKDPRRIVKEHTDWHSMYLAEQTEHNATKEKLRAAQKKIFDLEAQVVKLKNTASVVGKMRKMFTEMGGQLPA